MNRCLAIAFWDKITRTFPTLDDHSGAFPAFAAELADMSTSVERGFTMLPDYKPL